MYFAIYLSIYLSIHPSIYISIYLYIYLSIYISIYLSIYLSIYEDDERGPFPAKRWLESGEPGTLGLEVLGVSRCCGVGSPPTRCSGGCRCALIGVPCRPRMLAFSALLTTC